MMRFLLVVNPVAFNLGRIRKKLKKVIRALKAGGKNTVDYIITSAPGHATWVAQRALKEGYDVIIAAGGDGLLNEVVNAISGTSALLGIIPLGITNVFALETGIPMDPIKAVDVILNGKVRKIDVGNANGRKFVLMMGAGLEGLAIFRLNLKLKKRLGGLAYIISGLKNYFRRNPAKIRVKIEDTGEVIEGYEVVISNTSFHGGTFKMNPEARIDDGIFDICVFERFGLHNDLRYFLSFLLGFHTIYNDVYIGKGTSFYLESDGEVFYHVDSEPAGRLPLRVTIEPASLNVILP